MAKTFMAIGIAILLLGVLAAVMPDDENDDTQETTSTNDGGQESGAGDSEPDPTSEPDPEPEPEPEQEPDPITYEGQGDDVTDTFTTEHSLIRVELTHSGSSNFAIWVYTEDGDQEELLVNEIGDYDGSRYFNPPPGNFRMDVTADGPWKVTIHQPRPHEGEETPIEWDGNGDHASEVMSLESGLAVFDMTHDGSSNFAIWIYDSDGQRIDLIVNEIGSYEGSNAVQIPEDGFYVLDIVADGDWTIDVE